jgi:hypothetical protein
MIIFLTKRVLFFYAHVTPYPFEEVLETIYRKVICPINTYNPT